KSKVGTPAGRASPSSESNRINSGAALGVQVRNQGIGGSNPLCPTKTFQSLAILRTFANEPLVTFVGAPVQVSVQKRLALCGQHWWGHTLRAGGTTELWR